MRETVLAVVLGGSPSRNRTAVGAVARFWQTLSPARRKKLKVYWVLADRRIEVPEVHIPSEWLCLDELEDRGLLPDLWLALDADALPPMARAQGIVLAEAPARHAGLWKGVIRLTPRQSASAAALAEALAWVYDDPGLKEMMRRRRAAFQSNAAS